MKKYIDILVSGVWFSVLVVLMVRMPVINLLQDPPEGFYAFDLVLSALFCLTGIASPVLAYIFSKKQLFAVSFVNIFLFAAMLVLLVVSTASGNRGMFDLSLYFANLFCFVLGLEGNMTVYCLSFLILQLLTAVLFSVLFKQNKEK